MSDRVHQSGMAVADSIKQGLFFPRPLPQETIYSVCARFAAANSLSEEKASMYLLGHRRGGFHHEIQHGLNRLEHVSGGSLQATQDLLRERTVLSCILPFMTAQQRRTIFERMLISAVPQTSRRMIGLSWDGSDVQHFLRRCPDCVSEDRRARGFTYWHVEHQLLGVWTCPTHGRPLQWLPDKFRQKVNWRQAERDDLDFNETSVDAATLLALDSLAKTVLWTASMASVSCTVLNILVRSRLRRVGMIHTEVKITDAEIVAIHEALAGPLARTGISHFTRFQSPAWIKEVLIDPRASHPLRWALLIASTLGRDLDQSDGSRGAYPVTNADEIREFLHREYRAAMERVPQPTLFQAFYSPRIARAPDVLYRALSQSVQIQYAATSAGLSLNEARIWMRRDRKLAAHWRKVIKAARIQEATDQIRGFLSANPTAQRVNILSAQLRAVRLLERYDPDLLQSLLPMAWSKFKWQPTLFGEDTT
jgi:hypothetical protein